LLWYGRGLREWQVLPEAAGLRHGRRWALLLSGGYCLHQRTVLLHHRTAVLWERPGGQPHLLPGEYDLRERRLLHAGTRLQERDRRADLLPAGPDLHRERGLRVIG
jgi:hypothetical protein